MKINIKTLKFKIFAIFLIPTISIVYFTFFYVKLSDANIEVIEQQKENLKLVGKLIDFVHDIQIERGLSLVFLASKGDQNIQQKLQEAYKNSDASLALLLASNPNHSPELNKIPYIRNKVLDQNISFEESLNFYTHLNTTSINVIKYLLPKLDKNSYNALFLVDLELLKETTEELEKKDVAHWFEISKQNLDTYHQTSQKLLQQLHTHLQQNYNDTLSNLNIAVLLWIISILSGIYFTYLIHTLFNQHQKYTDDLELSSRTLDSYEGIIITDQDTNIIKINKGFERITGYSSEDVIGKKTNLLRSGKNAKSLYKAMWGSLHKTGTWSGEVLNKRKDGSIYSQKLSISTIYDSNGDVKNYVGHLFDITELRQAQEEALYQASHDSLTDLINRKYLLKRMKEEISRSKRYKLSNAFLFIDLDNFKSINDTYGHHIGDQLLIHVADSVRNCIRECDIVARISGDEFAVVLLDIDSGEKDILEVVSFVAKKILNELNHKVSIEAHEFSIGLSIGIRLFPKDQEDNEDQIIKDADTAMYEAKNSGKNRFVLYQG